MTLDADQMARRAGKITASILGDVCGVNPWRGPLDAWLRLTRRHEEDARDPYAGHKAWGHFVERELLRWYAETQGCEIAHFGTLEHPVHPWLLATPDAARAGERTLVEAKSVGMRMAHHWGEAPDGLPEYVMVQAIGQLEVCDADRVHVPASIGGAPPALYVVERDRELGAQIVEIARAFYFDHVLADDPPPVDATTSAKALERLFPKSHGDVVAAPPDFDEWAQKYRAAGKAADLALAEKERAKAAMCAAIGEHDGAISERWRATWHLVPETRVEAHTRAAGRRFDLRELKAKRSGGKAA